MNREQYLNSSIEYLRPLFVSNGFDIPQVRVSVGFPGGGSARKRIGEYWDKKATSDKIGQIFINPTIDEPLKMLDVLTHELVHACVGVKAGHKGPFKKLALGVGLTGKMTSTTAGPELVERLNDIIKKLGPIDHGTINLSDRKKQSTRLKKLTCIECTYTVRTAQTWIDAYGAVLCPCNNNPMEICE